MYWPVPISRVSADVPANSEVPTKAAYWPVPTSRVLPDVLTSIKHFVTSSQLSPHKKIKGFTTFEEMYEEMRHKATIVANIVWMTAKEDVVPTRGVGKHMAHK